MSPSTTNASAQGTTVNGALPKGSVSPQSAKSRASNQSPRLHAEQASNAWKRFEVALGEMSKFSSVYSLISEAMDKQRHTESEAQEKDERIDKLESAFDTQMEKSGKLYKKWDEEKQRLESTIKDVQAAARLEAQKTLEKQKGFYTEELAKQKTAHQREMGQARNELDSRRESATSLAKDLKEARSKEQKASADLSQCVERLRQWDGYTSALLDLNTAMFTAKVEHLFTRCCKFARSYFLRDLPSHVFVDQRQWDAQTRSLLIPLNLPPNNSWAAKQMRMAAALHTISKYLYMNIFKPCHVPESDDFIQAIKETLYRQVLADEQKERTFRAMLLSTHPSTEIDEAIKQNVFRTTKEVLAILAPIGGGNETAQKDLESIFRESALLWTEAQHSTKLVEASIADDESASWRWRPHPDFNTPNTEVEVKGQQVVPKFVMLNLFPRIFYSKNHSPIHPGYVLWPDQGSVIAAEREYGQCVAGRRPRSGRENNSQGASRRLSIANEGKAAPSLKP